MPPGRADVKRKQDWLARVYPRRVRVESGWPWRVVALLALLAASLPAAADAIPRDKQRERAEWWLAPRTRPDGSIPARLRLEAFRATERRRVLRALTLNSANPPAPASASQSEWSFLGPRPTNTPGGVFGSPVASGRVVALAMDPRNPDVVYAGAALGGVWKTMDGGTTWSPLTDDQPSLAIGSLALDPSNPDIVYAGTGEGNFGVDSYYGAGLLKSTDAGASWEHLPGPFLGDTGGARIAALTVQPGNGSVLLAASQGSPARGIYRSADGGVNWIQVLGGADGTEVLFDPVNPQRAWAALFGRTVYKSLDGGITWTAASGAGGSALPAEGVFRIELAIAPSRPDTLYAGLAADRQFLGLFKTTDGGVTWSKLSAAPAYCAPQCHYNNVLRVHPADANIVLAGGVHLYRSLDGGSTWANVSPGAADVSLHVDIHALAFDPRDGRLYVGNDGGVFRTPGVAVNPVRWINLNRTLAITQFYPGFWMPPDDPNRIFGGTQDNGTQLYAGRETWDWVACGDGGWVAGVPSLGRVYAACDRINIQLSLLNGQPFTFFAADAGIDRSDRVQFIAPLVLDPSDPHSLYFGTHRVWRTTDAGLTWAPISTGLGSGTISAIAAAPSDGRIVYAGTSAGEVYLTRDARTSAARWERIGAPPALPPRLLTRLLVDPADPNIVYASFSGFAGTGEPGHIFRLEEGAWQDITGTLPNVPVNDLERDLDQEGQLFAATDIGVFGTSDAGRTWFPLGRDLPGSAAVAVRFDRVSRTLVAATHGRGMWSLSVPAPAIPAAVVDAAAYSAGPLAPGSIASLFGAGLAAGKESAGALPLPTLLTGIRVELEGRAAPLFYASPFQINFQLPWELAGTTAASLVLIGADGSRSPPLSLPLAAARPAIFTAAQNGAGQGAVLVAGTGVLAASTGSFPGARPARRSEFISIYATGLGAVEPRAVSGAPAPAAPASRTTLPVSVVIGGLTVPAAFAGLAPGFAGLYQVDVQVPAAAPSGAAVTLAVIAGDSRSNQVTIAID